MLPVTAWPPGPPGSALSPFGKPRRIHVERHCHGFVLPKGAWIVGTGSGNHVRMFFPSWRAELYNQPARQPGTGILPGAPPRGVSRATPCPPPPPKKRLTHDQRLEAWRAWQRKTGNNFVVPPGPPGRQPPNFVGWRHVKAPSRTLVQPCSAGLVLGDGQNVVIVGCGEATITQAFSV